MSKEKTYGERAHEAFSTVDVIKTKIEEVRVGLSHMPNHNDPSSLYTKLKNAEADVEWLWHQLKSLDVDLEKASEKRKAPKKNIKVQIYEHEFGIRPDGEEWFETMNEAKAYVEWFNSDENPHRKGADGQYWSAEIDYRS